MRALGARLVVIGQCQVREWRRRVLARARREVELPEAEAARERRKEVDMALASVVNLDARAGCSEVTGRAKSRRRTLEVRAADGHRPLSRAG